MRKTALLFILLSTTLFASAQNKPVKFNQVLADSLKSMVVVDQIAASIPKGKYKELSKEEWQHYKDSVFGTHQQILAKIFHQYGYPGFDLVGKEGSNNFWLMVQHCDKTPAFQKEILEAMKPQVDKGNAAPKDYAYLVDRVGLNTGGKQVYGTQVTYNLNVCQAIPRPLSDSLTVNTRRKEVGLEPIEKYLNTMSELHFEMNKAMYEQKGITKPKLY
ncbi:MAG: hypothetical protein QM731_28775 [Chitinophagaceae bacterium]